MFFVITPIVNGIARYIVNRRREFSSQLMSAGTERGTEQRPDRTAHSTFSLRPSIPGQRAPSWAPWPSPASPPSWWATLLLGRGIGLAVALTAVGYGSGGTSRVVEGPRKAADRLVTVVVTVAFLIAMAPLVSVVVTVLANGIARFDAQFFTYSMRGVVGEGGGAYHAIIGTVIITALAGIMAIPVGLMTAVYLVEYGRRLPVRSPSSSTS